MAREASFDTNAVIRIMGVSVRQLNHWDRIGVISPSVFPAAGSGSRRQYSRNDLFLIGAALALRRANVSLDAVRRAVSAIRAAGIDSSCDTDCRLVGSESGVHYAGSDPARIAAALALSPVVQVVNLGRIAQRLPPVDRMPAGPRAGLIEVGGEVLQIVMREDHGTLRATCNAYHRCTGRGETVDEAIEMLRTAIAQAQAGETDRSPVGPQGRSPAGASGGAGVRAGASSWGGDW